MSVQAQLTYNGISFDVTRIKQFTQESVYDDSDTDQMLMKFTVSVQGLLTLVGNDASAINPSNSGDSPTATYNRIRHTLAVPRQAFSLYINDETLLEVDGLDAKNGPKPRVVSLSKLSTNSFFIEFFIEINIVECGDSPTSDYLSLRWQQSVVYNQRWFATVHTGGFLIVNSSLLTNPDGLRVLVTPPPIDSFQRTNAKYMLSEDGLKLGFEFDDVQYVVPPTDPALRSTGKVAVVTGQGEGAVMRILNFSARMEGGPQASKSDMANALLAIFLGYADAAGGVLKADNGQYFYQGGISCDPWDNIVEAQLSAKLKMAPSNTQDSLRLNLGFVDANPNTFTGQGEARPGIAPPLQGQSQFLGLISAAFNDMCVAGADDIDDDPDFLKRSGSARVKNGVLGRRPVVRLNASERRETLGDAPIVPSSLSIGNVDTSLDDDDWYDDPDPGIYEFYKVLNEYHTDENKVILPACSSAPSTPAIAVIQLAAAVTTLVSYWSVEKVGGPPALPPAESSDPNIVLLRTLVNPESINTSEDGAAVRYTLSGRYDYVYLDGSQADPASSWPIPPYLDDDTPADPAEEGDDQIVFGDSAGGGAADGVPPNAGLNA